VVVVNVAQGVLVVVVVVAPPPQHWHVWLKQNVSGKQSLLTLHPHIPAMQACPEPLDPQSESVVQLGVVVVVVVVGGVQQKPTSAGDSWRSPRLQASRILTVPLKLPFLCGFTQRTAAPAVAATMRHKKTGSAVRFMRASRGASTTGCDWLASHVSCMLMEADGAWAPLRSTSTWAFHGSNTRSV